LFFDAQVYNADRLNLSLLFSAAEAGAEFANYVQMTGFLENGAMVAGIQVKDVLSGDEFAIRARVVVNCAGPWLGRVLQLLETSRSNRPTKLLKAVVLVTRPLVQSVAVGIPSRSAYTDKDAVIKKGYRYLFITPWRHTSLIGTFQIPYERDPDELEVTEYEILDFIREINAAFPGALIKREDVYWVFSGLLPSADPDGQNGHAQLQKQYEIRDHGVEDEIQGLVSVTGVKYTTARGVGEKTVNLVLKKLGRELAGCRTADTPVHGGGMDCFEEFSDRALKARSQGVSADTLRHLLQTYGSEYRRILRYCDDNATWSQLVSKESPTIKAEVLHGVRVEMAQKLSDIIFRRTELGTAGYPGDACLYTCAEIMAAQLGWNKRTMFQEVDEVQQAFRGE
jgi:glycerol-3-phosphate dehydrogenase